MRTTSSVHAILAALTVGVIGSGVYWNEEALHGELVYDDAGTVTRNPCVKPDRAWQDVWKHDFWGTELVSSRSHKSFRPVTTMTYRWNYLAVETNVYWYKVVNYVLHGVVSGLSTLVCLSITGDMWLSVVGSFLYAIHPIHTEAVSNVSSRGEILMSMFYMIGYLIYVFFHRTIVSMPSKGHDKQALPGLFRTCIVSLVAVSFAVSCTVLSLLSKEHGVTLPLTCLIYDFCASDMTFLQLLAVFVGEERLLGPTEKKNRSYARRRLFRFGIALRTLLFSISVVVIAQVRLFINGDSAPDLIYDQNPAAFAKDFVTRYLSVPYVYYLYIETMVVPYNLCCDWSGESIKLIESLADPRAAIVLTFVGSFFYFVFQSLLSKSALTVGVTRTNKVLVQFILGWYAVPFLLSSNIIVKTGFMKAERVMYLPSLGFCFLLAYLLRRVDMRLRRAMPGKLFGGDMHWMTYVILACISVVYVYKTNQRNLAWANGYNLWQAAYETNTISRHTKYNWGLELSRRQESQPAHDVLAELLRLDPEDLTARFLFALVLRSLTRCPEALEIVEYGLNKIAERRKGVVGVRDNFDADQSRMLTAKGLCTEDIPSRGRLLWEAVQIDPNNDFAVTQGKELMAMVQQQQQMMQNPEMARMMRMQQQMGGGAQ